MVTITRKIEVYLTDNKKEGYATLRKWEECCFRAANTAASHMYFQNNLKEFFYLTDSAKILFADINKQDEEKDQGAERVLTTSKQNTTYQVLSSHFKGLIPSDIFGNLNAQLASAFKKETKEYFKGARALRTYKKGMPIPFSAKSLIDITLSADGRNYTFTLFGLNFKTRFGRDLSGNQIIFERALEGEYKLCNSSLQLKDDKVYLLAVFQFEKETFLFDVDKEAIVFLGLDAPLKIQQKNNEFYNIGSQEQYLHRRIAIRGAISRAMKSLSYNAGGKGRNKKLAYIENLRASEHNYINTLFFSYASRLIAYCLRRKIGRIVLKNYSELLELLKVEKITKENKEPLIRSWSFGSLANKIVHSAAKAGIEVVIPEKEKESSEN